MANGISFLQAKFRKNTKKSSALYITADEAFFIFLEEIQNLLLSTSRKLLSKTAAMGRYKITASWHS
jgi:hypothetical protein